LRTNAGEESSADGVGVPVNNQVVTSDVPQASTVAPAAMPAQSAQAPPPFNPSPFATRTPLPTYQQPSRPRFSPTVKMAGAIVIGILILIGIITVVLVQLNRKNELANQTAENFDSQSISLAEIDQSGAITINGKTLSINGQLRANGSLIMTPAAQPSLPTIGQIYYDQTSNHLSYYNGTEFVQLQTNKDASGNGTVNNITNLSVTNNTVSTSPAGGTTGKIAKFTSGQALGDSILTDSGTFLSVNGGLNLTASSGSSDFRLWPNEPTPSSFDTTEAGNVELGVKFQVDVPGTIKSIRFYKATIQDTVVIPVSLWTTAGTLVGQTTITVSGSGWKTATFASPLPVSPDTTYIASYHLTSPAPGVAMGYPFAAQYFSSTGVDNGPLHALASGLDGGNGVYKNSPTPSAPNLTFNSTNYWIDVVFNGSQPTPDSRIRINNAQISSSDLANDNNIAKRGSSQVFSGHNIFRNGGDSNDAFSIQKADTTPLFTTDTLDGRVYVGSPTGNSSNILLVLNNRDTTGDPVNPVAGAMYFNSADGAFRCYNDGTWRNCEELNASRAFSQYEEFMGGLNTSFSSPIGNLGWSAQAIGANGSLSFNPATPTPAADRPGVLALSTPAVANQGTTFSLANGSGGSTIIRRGNTIRTAVAMGTTTGQVLRVGLHNETTAATQPVSGVWWEADPGASAAWRYCYGNGTTATCAVPTIPVAIAANSWVRLAITVNDTGSGTSRITFTINDTVTTVSNVTVDNTARLSPALTAYGTDGAAKNFYWDYYQFTGTTSGAR